MEFAFPKERAVEVWQKFNELYELVELHDPEQRFATAFSERFVPLARR